MSHEQPKVTFEPGGRTVFVLPGTTILEAAARVGLTLDTPCGGGGTCGKCRVQMTAGAGAPGDADAATLTAAELAAGWRLACQTRIVRDGIVAVPGTSLFDSQQRIVATAATDKPRDLRPPVRKIHLTPPAPTLRDDTPDLLRLERELGRFDVDLTVVRHVAERLRTGAFGGTAVLADHRLVDLECGDTAARCYGMAFDIGTTTMVGVLLDLTTGRELALESRLNPQVSFGDDVLARIRYAGDTPANLEALHDGLVRELARMIETLCSNGGVEAEHVYELVFAGNTTMQHLLCGIDPTQLGQIPFVPAFGRGLRLPARELKLPINPRGAAYVFPVIGGFVGGDTVAGMLATQLGDTAGGPVLMVDIGTNGEIVLAHNGEIRASSTAAGPAFEGARIACGMRATCGAIEKVVLDRDVRYSVIGNTAPVGICGSGLIDLVAELLRVGAVSQVGRLLPPEQMPDRVPAAVRERVQPDADGKLQFVLAAARDGRPEAPVVLTQRDIRELQLASGAIRAGIRILARQAGIEPADLTRVLIAGGFGSFIRRSHAQRLGLMPADVSHRRIHYVGNVALSGARWALLSTEARERAEDLARQTRHVELSTDATFQTEFADAMIFPD